MVTQEGPSTRPVGRVLVGGASWSGTWWGYRGTCTRRKCTSPLRDVAGHNVHVRPVARPERKQCLSGASRRRRHQSSSASLNSGDNSSSRVHVDPAHPPALRPVGGRPSPSTNTATATQSYSRPQPFDRSAAAPSTCRHRSCQPRPTLRPAEVAGAFEVCAGRNQRVGANRWCDGTVVYRRQKPKRRLAPVLRPAEQMAVPQRGRNAIGVTAVQVRSTGAAARAPPGGARPSVRRTSHHRRGHGFGPARPRPGAGASTKPAARSTSRLGDLGGQLSPLPAARPVRSPGSPAARGMVHVGRSPTNGGCRTWRQIFSRRSRPRCSKTVGKPPSPRAAAAAFVASS